MRWPLPARPLRKVRLPGSLLALGMTALMGKPTLAAPGIDYAVLSPDFARGRHDDAVVARAKAALRRPPNAPREIHIEGVSAGLTRAPGVAAPAPQVKPDAAASRASLRDMNIMRDFALAWRLTGDRAYLRQTGRYLDAWATTYQLSFNPIDEGSFDALIFAYDLTEAGLSKGVRARVDTFLRRMATGYIESMETDNVPIKPTLTNNWQSHRIKLATLAAFQIGDAALQDRAHALFDKHLAANLRSDGSTLDFVQRDALHYVTFSLDSQLTAALAAKMHGQDWYHAEVTGGKSLTNTLDWLGQFASGKQTHIEFVRSVVPYDRQRAAAGGTTYQNKPWNPATARRTYLLAAELDPRFVSLRDALLAKASPEGAADVEPGDRIDWLMLRTR